jgi:hypothetical protein
MEGGGCFDGGGCEESIEERVWDHVGGGCGGVKAVGWQIRSLGRATAGSPDNDPFTGTLRSDTRPTT